MTKRTSFWQLPFLDKTLLSLIAILPWTTFFGVFGANVLSIPGINFLKEGLLALFIIILLAGYYRRAILPKFDLIDAIAGAFIAWMIFISVINQSPLAAYIFGGRYDFEWIIALLAAKHAVPLLVVRFQQILKVFFWSAGSALGLGILIRFVIGEDILLYFGFGGNLSNWTLGSQVPIFHGVEGANVRRFQGIFDGPNPAAAFLLLYIPLYLLYLRPYKDYHYLGGLGFIVLFTTFIYTYSRSALLGAIGAVGVIALFYGRSWIQKYPKQLMSALTLLLLVGSIGYWQYSSKFEDLILRKASTDGHLVRMINGWKEFEKEPMGAGLATSGPAYRYIAEKGFEKNVGLQTGENKEKEDVHIPESWHIQILVEGGVIGFILFMAFLLVVGWRLLRVTPFMAFAWVSIAIMATFLHIYEAMFVSLALALMSGLSLTYPTKYRSQK